MFPSVCVPGSEYTNGTCDLCEDGYWSPGIDGNCSYCGDNMDTNGAGQGTSESDCGINFLLEDSFWKPLQDEYKTF